MVDADGDATPGDCGSGETADSSTINGAIDHPSVSDTTNLKKRDVILVCPGEYFENVVVDKTVILQGVGGVAAGYATVEAMGAGDTITIESDGVKIDNLKITRPDEFDYPVLIESSDNEISHNWISGGDDGIRIEDGADGNSVHHNIIEDTDDDGIAVLNSSGNDIHHNTITTKLGDFKDGEGIGLTGGEAGGDNAIHRNTITMSAGFGIQVTSDNNDIHHNTIEDSEGGHCFMRASSHCAGIILEFFAEDNSVHNNIVTGSDDNGIESEGDRNDIKMNFVCENNVGDDGGHDIEIFATADENQVRNNTATDIVDGGTGTVEMNNSDCP